MRRGWLLALVALAVLGVSCKTPTPTRSSRPLPPDDPRPAAWMEALAESAHSRHSLRANAKLSLDSPDLRFRRPQRLVMKRPARLRVEVFGLFGQVAAVLVTDGRRFEWLEASRGRVEQGVVDDRLLWRLARIDLSPEEAVSVLLGVPFPMVGLERRPGRSRGEGGVEVPFGKAGGLEQVFAFDAQGRLVGLATHDESGTLLWEARFGAYEDVDGVAFAHEVLLEFPNVGARSSIRFEAVELNPDLSGDVFVLQLDRSAS